MSTSFGNEMIQLSVRGLDGASIVPSRSGRATRRPHHNSSLPKRRRDQHHHSCLTTTTWSPPLADRPSDLVEGPLGLRSGVVSKPASRGDDRYTVASSELNSRMTSPPSTLLPHGLFASRCLLPFDLNNTMATSSMMIRPNASAHMEQPLALLCGATMQRETSLSAKNLSFLQIRKPRARRRGQYTLTTLRQQLAEEWRGCF